MSASAWRPVLEGSLAERAREAVGAIADTLALGCGVEAGENVDRRGGPRRQATLARGNAGLAVFHAYVSATGGAAAHASLAAHCLDAAVEALATTPMDAGLYTGFSGIAWAAEHVDRLLEPEAPACEDDDLSQEIDQALLSVLAAESPWKGQFDLMSGLVGFGVYALERWPRPSAVRCLEGILGRLEETADRNGQGVAWFTPPQWLPVHERAAASGGHYNLGVAHGVPGVIALLAAAARLGILIERAGPLLAGSVRWLLAQRRPAAGGPSSFGYSAGPGIEHVPARLAWCYGDPGIASALLAAGRALGREDWVREALAIGAAAAAAPPEASGVVDAGICHGALGLAHLYNRLYQAGGGEALAEAARRWYGLGLGMRHPGQGIGGFFSWELREDGRMGWAEVPGFLSGAAGIGLALLSAVSPVEPRWDRVLLCPDTGSVDPRGPAR